MRQSRKLRAVAAFGGLLLALATGQRPAWADDACGDIAPGQAALRISVSGMRSTDGNVTITIYPDQPTHFLDGKYKVARQQIAVALPVTAACFVLPAPATYAVALFHDENGNQHLDTNALGIPTEGYGFSNNPTLYFGPPDLDQVKFPLELGGASIAVRMKY